MSPQNRPASERSRLRVTPGVPRHSWQVSHALHLNRRPWLICVCALIAGILIAPSAAAQGGPPPPDSEAVFVGYFYYHAALAEEVEHRRAAGSQTGEELLKNACSTIGIKTSSFWSLTPVIL